MQNFPDYKCPYCHFKGNSYSEHYQKAHTLAPFRPAIQNKGFLSCPLCNFSGKEGHLVSHLWFIHNIWMTKNTTKNMDTLAELTTTMDKLKRSCLDLPDLASIYFDYYKDKLSQVIPKGAVGTILIQNGN